MKNMKSTKRSLFLSAMALLLCTSMLIGTTYAWFTESVSSVNNIITGGNLDVELEWWNATDKEWQPVTKDTNVFTGSLWEPGHTEVVYLKVSNKGDLALKYQLGVNVASETSAVNAEGDQIWLSQYIKFGVVENGEMYAQGERAQAIADAQASAKLLKEGYSKSSTLYPTNTEKTTSETVALVVYMPETVGNEANYVGEAAPKINLGINLIATQFTWENDSFGDDYDKNATYYDVLVSTVEELYAAVEAATGDVVIAVDGNLVLTKALSKSGLNSIKFVAWDDEATIDQAIYNMYFNGAKVTFEGLNLTHGEKTYGDGGQTSTAFAVWHAKEVNYVDCTFARSVGTIHASLHNFIRCTFNGVENPNNTKSEYPLYICDGQDYNVIDCTFNCTNRGAILFYNDGGSGVDTLNISGTKFLGDIIDDKTAVEIHNNSTTQVYNVNIKDVAVGEGVINGLYRIKPANVGEVNVSVDGVADSVSTNKGFEDALTNTTATEIIVSLENDVTYDVAAWANDAMGGTGTETIVINGNGYTITFNQTNSDWNNIVTNGAKLIINNAKLTNAGKNDGPWNRHDLNFACDVELNNVISDKALAFKANATLNTVTINDANTSDTYAIWIQPKGQTINIDGLTIDMLDCTDGRGIKIDNQYLAAADEKAVTLNIKNATFKTEEKSAILVKSTKGATIKAENLDISGVEADSTNAVWVDSATADYVDLVEVTGANKIVEP